MAKPRGLIPSPPPGSAGSEAPVGFAPRDAARIGEATRAYERARKNSIIPRGGRRGGGGGGGETVEVAIGKADSLGVAARSGTTAGAGSWYAVTLNPANGALDTATTPLGGSPCWNLSASAVAPNAYIMLKLVDNNWWVDMESC